MKKVLLVVLIASGLLACGNANNVKKSPYQDGSYESWKQEAVKEIRLRPRYGGAVKNAEQKAADAALIKSYITLTGSRRKGSELLTKKGFEYLYAGNLRTAMYRFNQAWLLDSTDANIYSGFATVYYTFKDYKKAFEMVNQGLTINPKSSALLTDKGSIYMTFAQTSMSMLDLDKALSCFKESYAIDPLNQNTLYKLSTYYFDYNECDLALRYYKECMKLGGKPIVQRYKDAIKERCGS
jgi:tetratricopeptide (TPR) repeat protein